MRPTANFTLHAIFAACLAALAASSAAAGPTGGKEQIYFTITLQESRAAAGYGKSQAFEIKDYGFGDVAKVDGFTVKQKVKPAAPADSQWIADVERPAEQAGRPVGTSDVTMKRGTSAAPVLGIGKDLEAQDKMGNAPSSAGIGQAIGGWASDGQDDAAPPPQGSFRVKVKMPWLGCEEGRKYPSLTLSGGGKTYRMQDVTVTSCGGTAAGIDTHELDEIRFSYSKIEY